MPISAQPSPSAQSKLARTRPTPEGGSRKRTGIPESTLSVERPRQVIWRGRSVGLVASTISNDGGRPPRLASARSASISTSWRWLLEATLHELGA